jgi:hypothetical protein
MKTRKYILLSLLFSFFCATSHSTFGMNSESIKKQKLKKRSLSTDVSNDVLTDILFKFIDGKTFFSVILVCKNLYETGIISHSRHNPFKFKIILDDDKCWFFQKKLLVERVVELFKKFQKVDITICHAEPTISQLDLSGKSLGKIYRTLGKPNEMSTESKKQFEKIDDLLYKAEPYIVIFNRIFNGQDHKYSINYFNLGKNLEKLVIKNNKAPNYTSTQIDPPYGFLYSNKLENLKILSLVDIDFTKINLERLRNVESLTMQISADPIRSGGPFSLFNNSCAFGKDDFNVDQFNSFLQKNTKLKSLTIFGSSILLTELFMGIDYSLLPFPEKLECLNLLCPGDNISKLIRKISNTNCLKTLIIRIDRLLDCSALPSSIEFLSLQHFQPFVFVQIDGLINNTNLCKYVRNNPNLKKLHLITNRAYNPGPICAKKKKKLMENLIKLYGSLESAQNTKLKELKIYDKSGYTDSFDVRALLKK